MATIRMKLILLPLLCFIANAQKQCPLSCYVDYIQTMDCTWKERNNNSHISLQVFRVVSNRFSHENNCTFTRHSMLPMEDERWIHYYTCIMHFQMFMNIDKFKITLKSNSPANTSQTCIIEEFIPSQNIHLKAPQQLSVTVNSTTRKVIITWQNHASQYLKNCLEHEVEFWSRETKEVNDSGFYPVPITIPQSTPEIPSCSPRHFNIPSIQHQHNAVSTVNRIHYNNLPRLFQQPLPNPQRASPKRTKHETHGTLLPSYSSSRYTNDVKVKKIVNDIQHLAIEESELKPVTDYKARVRSIPSRRTDYNGRWSKWSSEIKWKTNSDSQVVKNIEVEPNPYTFLMEETYYSEPKKAQFQTFPMVTSATDSPSKQSSLLIVVLLPISLAIIISILLYFRIHIRIVNKVWIHIPNPGNFFQPLYSEHNGNFKEWVRNDQSTIQKRSRRSSVHEITKMKRSLEDEADTVIITPRIEAVSNITYIKPIPIHYTSALDPNSLKHNNDADSMYVKKNCLIDPRNRFYSNSVLEYSNSICGLSGNQSIVPTEGQQVESWLLFEDLANATLLSMMPQDPNGEYNYSDDYCTLSHSDTSHGLVPTKIGLQLNCDGCQAEKRDVPMSLEAIDSDKLPSICTTSTQQ